MTVGRVHLAVADHIDDRVPVERHTPLLSVPKTSSTVTIKPVGKKGTRLVSVTAIWTYRALVR